jgi:hypothetical protein
MGFNSAQPNNLGSFFSGKQIGPDGNFVTTSAVPPDGRAPPPPVGPNVAAPAQAPQMPMYAPAPRSKQVLPTQQPKPILKKSPSVTFNTNASMAKSAVAPTTLAFGPKPKPKPIAPTPPKAPPKPIEGPPAAPPKPDTPQQPKPQPKPDTPQQPKPQPKPDTPNTEPKLPDGFSKGPYKNGYPSYKDANGNEYSIDKNGFMQSTDVNGNVKTYNNLNVNDFGGTFPPPKSLKSGETLPPNSIPLDGKPVVPKIGDTPPSGQTIQPGKPGYRPSVDTVINAAGLVVGIGTILVFIPGVTGGGGGGGAPATDATGGTGTTWPEGTVSTYDDGTCPVGYTLDTVNKWCVPDGTSTTANSGTGSTATGGLVATTGTGEDAELDCYMNCCQQYGSCGMVGPGAAPGTPGAPGGPPSFVYQAIDGTVVQSPIDKPCQVTENVSKVMTPDGTIAYTYNKEPLSVMQDGTEYTYESYAIAQDQLYNGGACAMSVGSGASSKTSTSKPRKKKPKPNKKKPKPSKHKGHSHSDDKSCCSACSSKSGISTSSRSTTKPSTQKRSLTVSNRSRKKPRSSGSVSSIGSRSAMSAKSNKSRASSKTAQSRKSNKSTASTRKKKKPVVPPPKKPVPKKKPRKKKVVAAPAIAAPVAAAPAQAPQMPMYAPAPQYQTPMMGAPPQMPVYQQPMMAQPQAPMYPAYQQNPYGPYAQRSGVGRQGRAYF